MAKEKVLVVGLGEVGRPLYELLIESKEFDAYGFDIDKQKMRAVGQKALPKAVDTMHICIPCADRSSFAKTVATSVKQFKPKLLIINSTIPPGTTKEVHKQCNCLAAHSPIRGVHKSLEHMKWEIKRWTKYIGGATPEAGEAACKHFEKLGLRTKVVRSSTETELAKLFETTYRVWMITCFQEMHRASQHFKTDFNDIVDFLDDTHKVRFDRPIMFPGVIGGHCLIPNVELLLKSYDSAFLRLALESNEKRKNELKDNAVRMEINKIERRIENATSHLLNKPQKRRAHPTARA